MINRPIISRISQSLGPDICGSDELIYRPIISKLSQALSPCSFYLWRILGSIFYSHVSEIFYSNELGIFCSRFRPFSSNGGGGLNSLLYIYSQNLFLRYYCIFSKKKNYLRNGESLNSSKRIFCRYQTLVTNLLD